MYKNETNVAVVGDQPSNTLQTYGGLNREQAILKHLPQVTFIARSIHLRLPKWISLDDLISAGVVGLISAIDRFRNSQGATLRTYAECRIRGAILDSLRSQEWSSRTQQDRLKQIRTAVSELYNDHHRMPSEDEIATHLGVPLIIYQRWLSECCGLRLVSLENTSTDDDGYDLGQVASTAPDQWPYQIVEQTSLRYILAGAIGKLPQREMLVLRLHYYEERPLKEIAKLCGLAESRISQLKSQAILRLRFLVDKSWSYHGDLLH